MKVYIIDECDAVVKYHCWHWIREENGYMWEYNYQKGNKRGQRVFDNYWLAYAESLRRKQNHKKDR